LTENERDEDGGLDLFEKPGTSGPSVDDEADGEEASVLSRNVPNQPEELPIELISLTDRYVLLESYYFSVANSCVDLLPP
jgi:hypothetical protein